MVGSRLRQNVWGSLAEGGVRCSMHVYAACSANAVCEGMSEEKREGSHASWLKGAMGCVRVLPRTPTQLSQWESVVGRKSRDPV